MKVRCQIVRSDKGYEGVITNESGVTVFNSGFCDTAEDADAEMERIILRNKWNVQTWPDQHKETIHD